MVALGLDVSRVLPTAGSWLEREVMQWAIPSTSVTSKDELTERLSGLEFDVFVSTGCKFILPIRHLQALRPGRIFLNIHPSKLPDLRGADPIPAAILFRRNSGVTCHLMDDGIDTGKVIASQAIRYFDGLDARLLYNACFHLEPEVFELAWKRKFSPRHSPKKNSRRLIYYTFRKGDNEFSGKESPEQLVAKIRAFNTPSKGFHFRIGNDSFSAFGAEKLPARFLSNLGFHRRHKKWTVDSVLSEGLIISKRGHAVRLTCSGPAQLAKISGQPLSAPVAT